MEKAASDSDAAFFVAFVLDLGAAEPRKSTPAAKAVLQMQDFRHG
jgi:hypothetical protein